jgi:hypothetical protein
MAAVEAVDPPLHLPLGKNARERIEAKFENCRREIDAWREKLMEQISRSPSRILSTWLAEAGAGNLHIGIGPDFVIARFHDGGFIALLLQL